MLAEQVSVCATNGMVHAGEQENLRAAPPHDAAGHYTGWTLFSAKESIYKAPFPIVRVHFDFFGARVHFAGEENGFSVELSPELRKRLGDDTLIGRHSTDRRHTMTSVFAPAA